MPDQLDSIGETKGAGNNKRRIFTETVPRNESRMNHFMQQRPDGYGDCQERRLRIFRYLQFFLWTLETELAQGFIQRAVRFFKHATRSGITIVEVASHSNILRALPGENDCNLTHTRLIVYDSFRRVFVQFVH